jgi:hypothetical protein
MPYLDGKRLMGNCDQCGNAIFKEGPVTIVEDSLQGFPVRCEICSDIIDIIFNILPYRSYGYLTGLIPATVKHNGLNTKEELLVALKSMPESITISYPN